MIVENNKETVKSENEVNDAIRRYKNEYYDYLKIIVQTYAIISTLIGIVATVLLEKDLLSLFFVLSFLITMFCIHKVSPGFDRNENDDFNLAELNNAGKKIDEYMNRLLIFYIMLISFVLISTLTDDFKLLFC
jgi:hypothetical protein